MSGNSATGQVGTLAPSTETLVALTGVSATGEVGSLGKTASNALSGVSATGQVGTLTPTTSKAVSGVSATGQVGSVGVSASVALTGNAATGQVGSLNPVSAGSVGISGVSAEGQAGSVGVNVTVALTGVQAVGEVGNLSIAGQEVIRPGHEVELYEPGKSAPWWKRRSKDEPGEPDEQEDVPTPEEPTPKKPDRRAIEQAEAIIAKAAREHVLTADLPKQARYGDVRRRLKPFKVEAREIDWATLYERLYQQALTEAIRAELEIELQLQAQYDEDALVLLLLEA